MTPRVDVEALTGEPDGVVRRVDYRIIRALRQKIRSFRPDLVVANGGATLRYALAARPGLEYSLAYISIGEPHYWIQSRFSRWANRMMLRRTDSVLTVSDATRAQLLELEPGLEGRVHTTYTGVPPDLLKIERFAHDGPLRVLMIGSLTPEKDPELALRVVGILGHAIFRFVGDGPLIDRLRETAAGLPDSVAIEFAGSVSDVSPHLAWADVLLLTSLSEGLPGAILEAGAAGVPTVAVDVGGVREAVVDGVTGFVTSRDYEELASVLHKLDSDRALLASMGEAAREHMASKFLLETVIDNYAEVLRGLRR
ncbi:MAG TPA: glycosyltransferase family 1 protein [Acidimicrobiia bacterium]|nr:glycosyltransferase family 1 protein [Acidimicrobiia bacterium]